MSDGFLVYGFHCSVSLPFVKQKCLQLKNTINITLSTEYYSIYSYVTFLFHLAQLFGMPVVKGMLNLR